MRLKPAQRAGDAPRIASEQGTSTETPHPPSYPVTRLSAPTRAARLHTEREQWRHRRSLERQLHDGAALRISALALQLGLLRHRVTEGDPDLHASIDDLQDELHAALQELRDIAGKIYPPLLDEAGLGPALREVADRMGRTIRVDAPADRFGPAAEGAAYFAVVGCLEAVSPDAVSVEGVSKRAPAASTSSRFGVIVRREDRMLAVDVVGVDLRHADAMLGPVRNLDGVVDVGGCPDAGTITVRIPCE